MTDALFENIVSAAEHQQGYGEFRIWLDRDLKSLSDPNQLHQLDRRLIDWVCSTEPPLGYVTQLAQALDWPAKLHDYASQIPEDQHKVWRTKMFRDQTALEFQGTDAVLEHFKQYDSALSPRTKKWLTVVLTPIIVVGSVIVFALVFYMRNYDSIRLQPDPSNAVRDGDREKEASKKFHSWFAGLSADQQLAYALINQRSDLVRLALAQSPSMSLPESLKDPTLFYVIELDDLSLMQEFIDRGAAVHLPNRQGVTLLHLAVSRGDARLVKLLLKAGCDPQDRAGYGLSPLEVAQTNGLAEISAILELSNSSSSN